MTDIVERLRKGGTDSWTELAVMLDEAADEIEMLRAAVGAAGAENEKLREALVQLRDCDWVITPADRIDAVRDIARQALGDN